jgi:protein-tyrosine phosphatase
MSSTKSRTPCLSTIIEGKLYLSDCRTAQQYELLKQHNIEQIVSIGSEFPKHETNEFKILHIDLADKPDENITAYFSAAHAFINQAPTLVHCYAGVSRSATIVLSYLMYTEQLSVKDALIYCVSKRPIINPNIGFLYQLKQYERNLQLF